MKFVIQRVKEAKVEVDGAVTGEIGKGFLVLIGVVNEDTKEIADKIGLNLKESLEKYGKKISGYAVTSVQEYFAETFASYMIGEDRADPKMREFFDEIARRRDDNL